MVGGLERLGVAKVDFLPYYTDRYTNTPSVLGKNDFQDVSLIFSW